VSAAQCVSRVTARQPKMQMQVARSDRVHPGRKPKGAMQAGFNHHFTKPIEPDALLELLRPADRRGWYFR
jgi:CheY-like chemotaxis protein